MCSYFGDTTLGTSRAGRKAPINRTHSRRFARFGDARPSRSVWSACVFSAAFPRQPTIRWRAGSCKAPFRFSHALAYAQVQERDSRLNGTEATLFFATTASSGPAPRFRVSRYCCFKAFPGRFRWSHSGSIGPPPFSILRKPDVA